MAQDYGIQLGNALIEEARRRLFVDSQPRIHKCLSLLTEEQIWHRPNRETVSVGNLVLHLCGNVRQQIVSTLGGAADNRIRSVEFSETGPIPTEQLLQEIDKALDEVRETLDRLDPESLLQMHPVQSYNESGVSILVHVIEHFSYHVGQITWVVKSTQAVDVGYYAGADLDVTN
ncbi:MAG: DUF1572 domain-containing protein [Deltaproteobacteria bacterium]|nr:DUF1572 domain-containing protein [Deltaproteobacteria bacterium]